MLNNSDIYLCSQFKTTIQPNSNPTQLSGIPKNMQRTSPVTFTLCDPNPKINKTSIVEMNLNGEQRVIEVFEGVYTSWDFSDDHALLLNREGDFLMYNMLNKNVNQAQKQHPGLYVDAEIMHTNEHFITCGGSLKNQVNGNPERIIKIWGIDRNDCLTLKSRINTGHQKPIDFSFLVNKNNIVSFSSDKTIRITNLATEQLSSIIRTDIDLLSGCQLDYNTIIGGGNSKNIRIYDQRSKKTMNVNLMIQSELVQIVNFTRFTDNHIIVSNINEINGIDMRNWQISHLADCEGERISQVLTLNNSDFVVGNRERTVQFWKAS